MKFQVTLVSEKEIQTKYTYMYIQRSFQTDRQTYSRWSMQTDWQHTYIHTHARTHARTHVRTYIHTYMYIQRSFQTDRQTYGRWVTQTDWQHTYIHTHARTHARTYIHTLCLFHDLSVCPSDCLSISACVLFFCLPPSLRTCLSACAPFCLSIGR